jgi:signal transduction histidine kinase
MQGRKGVGRYAASVLGNDLLLETVTPEGDKTTILVEWNSFELAEYLEDVEVLIETEKTAEPQGTRLTITGDASQLADWDTLQFNKLRFELKKLISPVGAAVGGSSSQAFAIELCISRFLADQREVIVETIEPYPIFDLFDYRIAGSVSANGQGSLTYSTQKARNTPTEEVPFDLGGPTHCGDLGFDIRVYDREKDSIEMLIERGLKDEFGNYVGRLQARQLLNDYNGIGVYRHGFRIRPLGDADFDWLKLNEQRIQNPSLRVGSNQVIGYVTIQAEELSGLHEKSARDGLKENNSFQRLKIIAKEVIARLEQKRFDYRRKAGLSRPVVKLERELEKLFAFDDLKRGVRARLAKGGVDSRAADEIIGIISKEEEEKNKLVEDIRKAVAIYQGQATLGKIVNVILHEGRRPLNYFRNQVPNLDYWLAEYKKTGSRDALDQFMSIAGGVGQNADFFVKLFSRLDPLAAGKRGAKAPLLLKKAIEEAISVFTTEMERHAISFELLGPADFRFSSWAQDIYAIFTNLADNSIYWMKEKRQVGRKISVAIQTSGERLEYIDYRDTGPGIEPAFIASEVIFEPEFSTKPGGTGLGLAIAGEAANRIGLELRALESSTGAYFRFQPRTEDTE